MRGTIGRAVERRPREQRRATAENNFGTVQRLQNRERDRLRIGAATPSRRPHHCSLVVPATAANSASGIPTNSARNLAAAGPLAAADNLRDDELNKHTRC